jgi:ATP-dependent DNA helicase 2 subunit 1
LIFLPYAEDLRDLDQILENAGMKEECEVQNNPLELLDDKEQRAAKLLVRNLAIKFDSRNFENVSVQKFYSGLQSLALGEEQPEEVEDTLKPDREGMNQYAPIIDNFKSIYFDGNDEDPKCQSLLPKKPATSRTGTTGAASQTKGASQASTSSTKGGPAKKPAAGKKAKKDLKDISEEEDSEEEVKVKPKRKAPAKK